MPGKFPPDLIKRVEREYIESMVSLSQLASESERRFGAEIPFESIRAWAKDYGWERKRRAYRVRCPHCQGDITKIVHGESMDVAYVFSMLINSLVDEISSSIANGKGVDPRKSTELRNLIKESGIDTRRVGRKTAMTSHAAMVAMAEKAQKNGGN